ncbi:lytic transglycosylase domain-containing protein [Niveibacterium terrae]|uniref:lytic transglycosylase domain-containing protein n=1 Tax=Niveibacterium terrae TaxID=3373598 RepID=UPI003A8E460D
MKRLAALLALVLAPPTFAGSALDVAEGELAGQLLATAVQYERGDGLTQDVSRAAEFYCDAARYGSAEAFFALGWMYGNGQGVARSEEIAATLIGRAAHMGFAPAVNAQRFFGPSAGVLPPCLMPRPPVANASSAPAARQAIADDADLDQILASLAPNKRRVAQLIRLLSPQYAIDPRLALAVAAAESNFESLARSPRNAFGVMQLIPGTAQRFKVVNLYDPTQNIRGGLAYLRWLLSYYRGDVLLALAAYNAGEGAVDRCHGIPPYRETIDYVKRIYGMFRKPSHPFDEHLVSPSPAIAFR